MLRLDDKKWSDLKQAYGSADRVAEDIKRLQKCWRDSDDFEALAFELWSSLCHQDDVYTGSYAAVPHIVQLYSENPELKSLSLIQLVICIEIRRGLNSNAPEIPEYLQASYGDALSVMHQKIQTLSNELNEAFSAQLMFASFAVRQKQYGWAEALLEFEPRMAATFLNKFFDGEFDRCPT